MAAKSKTEPASLNGCGGYLAKYSAMSPNAMQTAITKIIHHRGCGA
jgi:hypothetical protein